MGAELATFPFELSDDDAATTVCTVGSNGVVGICSKSETSATELDTINEQVGGGLLLFVAQDPDHPLNIEPVAGAATKVNLVPSMKFAWQVKPQAMAALGVADAFPPDTAPMPLPVNETETRYVAGVEFSARGVPPGAALVCQPNPVASRSMVCFVVAFPAGHSNDASIKSSTAQLGVTSASLLPAFDNEPV